MLNHSLTTGGMESAIFTQERGFNIFGRTLICRQLFAGHVVGSRLMKRKGKIHRMISIILSARGTKRVWFQADAHGREQWVYNEKFSSWISSGPQNRASPELILFAVFIAFSVLPYVHGWSLQCISEIKQPRRRRQQKPHKFAYLTMKNGIFARYAHAFFFFWHFEDVLVFSTPWNELFCSCVDDVSIWWQMLIFLFLCPKPWFQFNSRIVRTHFSSIMTLRHWKKLMIVEARSYPGGGGLVLLYETVGDARRLA